MNCDMSRTRKILFLFAVMLSNIAIMGDAVIYPISYNLYEAFPDQPAAVNFILSGPALIIVISSLFATVLLKKISKKNLMLLGGVMFACGSIFGAAINDAMYMALARGMVGVSQGFINVTALGLIVDVYCDENERAKMMGFFNASMNFIGMIFGFLAGWLASNYWQDAFRLYYLAIPMLIMMVVFIPNMKETHLEIENKVDLKDKNKEHMGGEYWRMIVTLALFYVCSMIFAYYISVYVEEHALGDADVAGTIVSLGQLISLIMAVSFGRFYAFFKKKLLIIAYLIAGLAFLSIYCFPSLIGCIVGYSLNSVAYIFAMAYSYSRGSIIVPESRVNDAISICTATYAVGSFVATYFVTALMAIFNTSLLTPILIVPMLICFGLTIYEVVFLTKKNSSVMEINKKI